MHDYLKQQESYAELNLAKLHYRGHALQQELHSSLRSTSILLFPYFHGYALTIVTLRYITKGSERFASV